MTIQSSTHPNNDKTVFSKLVFGTNMFQSLRSNSIGNSDEEFCLSINNPNDDIEIINDNNVGTDDTLENMPLSQRISNYISHKDENHLKSFNGAESFEKECVMK